MRQAPSALLKVREDLRAAGAITWSQVRCLRHRGHLPPPPSAAAAGCARAGSEAARMRAR